MAIGAGFDLVTHRDHHTAGHIAAAPIVRADERLPQHEADFPNSSVCAIRFTLSG